ncbi:hypothetical protein T265_00204 [Opisthorchis viverrini]|uniref:Uncharacterized protein n=1 Tax=Opisthorchis viverrini TaxID=6198 RepID=A0A075A6L4_OPIVI|nr:hypothetical protein T265_00204 [Opisthorchis viverrini]KER34012.1 hypothetical protein T265_00204 [Opisthorchis viverrini]
MLSSGKPDTVDAVSRFCATNGSRIEWDVAYKINSKKKRLVTFSKARRILFIRLLVHLRLELNMKKKCNSHPTERCERRKESERNSHTLETVLERKPLNYQLPRPQNGNDRHLAKRKQLLSNPTVDAHIEGSTGLRNGPHVFPLATTADSDLSSTGLLHCCTKLLTQTHDTGSKEFAKGKVVTNNRTLSLGQDR